MVGSVFVRKTPAKSEFVKAPFNFINGEFLIAEDGSRKFVERPVVAPSLACDFDVISNSMRNGGQSVASYRENIDPVDMFVRHPELFNNVNF